MARTQLTIKEQYLRLNELFSKEEDSTFIVEGKKDTKALRRFNIKHIHELSSPIFLECEHLAKTEKKLVILTDLDPTGRKLFSSLKEGLTRNGARFDCSIREFLFKNTELRQIEGLVTYFKEELI